MNTISMSAWEVAYDFFLDLFYDDCHFDSVYSDTLNYLEQNKPNVLMEVAA